MTKADIDTALKAIRNAHLGVEQSDFERGKSRWANLAAAAGAKQRVEALAKDLLQHFQSRTDTLKGKALIVCMIRENCVRLYDALTALSGCPEIKVVMTGNLSKDSPEWSRDGHITTKTQRMAIKERLKNPDDPLQIVIVCDMWLTGTDIPCLHTLYLDKPIQGHNIIQAISRVNRVFEDKPHGLIVDFIGIGDELREATNKYTQGGGKGEPAPDIETTAKPLFFECLDEVRQLLPEGKDYGAWRRMSRIDLEDLYSKVYGTLTETNELRDHFLHAELRLTSVFLLVKHLDDCRRFVDEVIFAQRVRNQIQKTIPGRKQQKSLEKAVRDLVDDNVETEGVVDIFKAAGIERADISILHDSFLQTFKDKPQVNLRLKLLEMLVRDEIQIRQKKNIARARSFREMLESTLKKYRNRLIDAAVLVQTMIEIRKEMEKAAQRARDLGLEDDELAFYDAVVENYETIYDEPIPRDLIHEVVQSIKRNLKVDWTQPHRDDVKSEVRAAVRRTLARKNVKQEDLEPFIQKFIEQTEALFADWPLAA